MLSPRIPVAIGVVATLTAVVVLIAGYAGGDGGGDGEPDKTTQAATERSNAAGAAEKSSADARDRGDRNEGNASDSGDDSSDEGGSVAGQPASGPSPEAFETSLRAIVSESLTRLAPLAQGRAAAGSPELYAQMLADAVPQMDDTIGRLEALGPPAGAEAGTDALIETYAGMREAIARGAKDFSSGKQVRIEVALVYLEQAAADFRAGLAEVTGSLDTGLD